MTFSNKNQLQRIKDCRRLRHVLAVSLFWSYNVEIPFQQAPEFLSKSPQPTWDFSGTLRRGHRMYSSNLDIETGGRAFHASSIWMIPDEQQIDTNVECQGEEYLK